MKGQEQEMTAGIISSSGRTPAPAATAASSGISRLAVAVFEVSSVRNVTDRHNPIIIASTGADASTPSWSAIS